MKQWIYDLSMEALRSELERMGLPPYSHSQIMKWLYGKNKPSISGWSNISKHNRMLLSEQYNTAHLEVRRIQPDATGTKKFLIGLADDLAIESVLIPEKHHYTFCISTQVGCPLNCSFCATGAMGFRRNLSVGEILNQILIMSNSLKNYHGKLNLVFMGMGEPLLNYKALKQALQIITAEDGLSISPRNITVSTAGILAGLKAIEHDFPNLKISFSLNASGGPQRLSLMPVEKREKLADILDHFRCGKRKHRITFEYVLIKGINDRPSDAKQVVRLLHGIPAKINLIPLNPVDNHPFSRPDSREISEFQELLADRGMTVVVRWSKGGDIRSACGQLAPQFD